MKRFVLVVVLALVAALPLPAAQAAVKGYVADPETKIHVMGEWAHPDDDTSIIGPCGGGISGTA